MGNDNQGYIHLPHFKGIYALKVEYKYPIQQNDYRPLSFNAYTFTKR